MNIFHLNSIYFLFKHMKMSTLVIDIETPVHRECSHLGPYGNPSQGTHTTSSSSAQAGLASTGVTDQIQDFSFDLQSHNSLRPVYLQDCLS